MSVIENLLELYAVDRQMRGLQAGVDNATTRLDVHRKQVETLESELGSLQQQQKLAMATAANLETEGNAVDARIEKLREDLKTTATTKQYNAILGEVNNLKTSRGELDERAIAELERAESIGGDIEVVQGNIAERTTLATSAEAELQEREEAVKGRLDELKVDRAAKAECIPPAALVIFDETANDYDGDSMARIEEIDRKRLEFACSSCNVFMPFSIVNAIISDGDNLRTCEGCRRILFVPEELRAGLVVKK